MPTYGTGDIGGDAGDAIQFGAKRAESERNEPNTGQAAPLGWVCACCLEGEGGPVEPGFAATTQIFLTTARQGTPAARMQTTSQFRDSLSASWGLGVTSGWGRGGSYFGNNRRVYATHYHKKRQKRPHTDKTNSGVKLANDLIAGNGQGQRLLL